MDKYQGNVRFLIAVLLMATLNAVAAPDINHPTRFRVNRLYLENGAAGDRVVAVRRDASGYLWVATDNGLKRYDGYQYTLFENDPKDLNSLGSNLLNGLLLDSEQRLWIGGRMLSTFNPDSYTFDNYEVTGGNGVWGMAEGKDGILWLAAENYGLVGFDSHQRQVIYQSMEQEREVPEIITGVLIDRSDASKLWLTTAAGVFRFETQTREFHPVLSTEALGGERLVPGSLQMDRDGNLWVISGNGLYVINPQNKTFRHYRRESGNPGSLSTNVLTAVLIDSEERVWIGTDKEGVHLYQPGTNDFFHIPASVSDSSAFGPGAVNDIYEDDNGSLWFSMDSFGVQRISDHLQMFATIGSGDSDYELSWDSLLDLHEDRKGRIWIATDGGGLNRFDPQSGRIARYIHDPHDPASISSDSVLSLKEDDQGMLWVGTWAGGLNRLNPRTGKFTHYMHNPGAPENRTLANNNIFQIVEDSEGWFWLSVWNFGVQRFNPATGEFVTFHFQDQSRLHGLVNGAPSAIETSRYGHIWIGGYEGLEIYDFKTQRFTQVPLLDITEEIYDLYEDQQGVLWVGAAQGLIRYDHKTGAVKHYTTEDGLPDPFIASIEEDNNGYLWLGTRGGLSRFDPQSETFDNFDKHDGVAANEFNRFSHLYSRSGLMYFGGPSGLTIFDPNHIPKNSHVPNVVLTELELFQKPVITGRSPYLPRPINRMDKLTLPYSQNDVALGFAALSFIAPAKNRYRYRLKGLEENWSEVNSSQRRARYTNLDPGHYQFQVTGSNNDGVWNSTGVTLDLEIVPPWWMTWWALTMAIVSGLYGVYGFMNWRLRVNRRRAEELSNEIEERRAAQAELFHIAYHDVLTGLPNRLWLLERLGGLIERAKSDKQMRYALLFIDGDRFKQINDMHGHQLGDQILDLAAKRLQLLLPEHYHAMRLGGDEFTVLVERFSSEEQVAEICKTIIDEFNQPLQVDKNQMFFKVSIGLVFCDHHYDYPGQVLRDADIAMYKAKERGKGNYQIFDTRMRDETLQVAQLETDLYDGLEQNQFFLLYQPIVDLKTGELSGFEALARWRHPERGLIPPDRFIAIAEDSGLIFTLGSWVLRQACTQLAAWIREFSLDTPPTMAINLSSLELNPSYFLAQLDRVLLDTGVDSSLLKLEITESTLMQNRESMNLLLDELHARKIQLAIDDFGAGYSSLKYLSRLPVQVLKIDRRFIEGMCGLDKGNRGSVEIVRAIISLAHSLNIMVVAKGIETEQQYRMLKSHGCGLGQGYHIAEPLSAGDATRFMHYEPCSGTEVRIATGDAIVENIGPVPGARRRYRDR